MAECKPVDTHGCYIKVGDWLIPDAQDDHFFKVLGILDEAEKTSTWAGFRATALRPGESVPANITGLPMGNLSKWEVVARGGSVAPTKIERDTYGRPMLRTVVAESMWARLWFVLGRETWGQFPRVLSELVWFIRTWADAADVQKPRSPKHNQSSPL